MQLYRQMHVKQILQCFLFQLRVSFKEVKKRFSNLKFNFLKRNDRTRNRKAIRNQLQQVELYDEKLQASVPSDRWPVSVDLCSLGVD